MPKIRKTRPRTKRRKVTAFVRWFEASDLTAADLIDRLDVSKTCAYELAAGRFTPGAELRIRIEDLTEGAVSYRDW